MTKFFNISVDTTLGGASPSDEVVSSQKALKTYIDNNSGGGTLPSQTGHAGEFLTTDGTDASWSDKPLVNTATGSNSLSVLGDAATYTNSVNIGKITKITGFNAVALGYGAQAAKQGTGLGSVAKASGEASVAIGIGATASGNNSIQISAKNNNTNPDANTFKVANANGNFEIMSANGTIPEARLADTTSATAGQVLTLDSNLDAVWATPSGGGDIDCGTMS